MMMLTGYVKELIHRDLLGMTRCFYFSNNLPMKQRKSAIDRTALCVVLYIHVLIR